MNQTDGSMKSVNAVFAGRIRNSACTTPMAIAVTPMGTTSNTHQIRASMNRPMAALPSRLSTKCSPAGSTASGHRGDSTIAVKAARPSAMKTIRRQSTRLAAGGAR